MLDSTAKISDIISSLQESEGINQKAELKSILVDKGITVEDTEDMAGIVNKVNELVKLDPTCIPKNIKDGVNVNGVVGNLMGKKNPVFILNINNSKAYHLISRYGADEYWIIDEANPNILAEIDDSGNIIKSFTLPINTAYDYSNIVVTKNYILFKDDTDHYQLRDKNDNLIGTGILSKTAGYLLYLIEKTSRILTIENAVAHTYDLNFNLINNVNIINIPLFIQDLGNGSIDLIPNNGQIKRISTYAQGTTSIHHSGIYTNYLKF